MKTAPISARQKVRREEIAQALRASFRIEGIAISAEQAQAVLQKVEASLGKAPA